MAPKTSDEGRAERYSVYWKRNIQRDGDVLIDFAESFDARGMKLVYGRADHFGNKAAFHMDVWRRKDGVLLARLWSNNREVDGESLRIRKHTPDCPVHDERWVPEQLRIHYSNWLIANF